jgi:hypothetical protein
MEVGTMLQGTAAPSPSHTLQPDASIPSLEQLVSNEIRGKKPALGDVHGELHVSGHVSGEEQGSNMVQ